MKPRHQVSRAAIELIKRFEGYRAPGRRSSPTGAGRSAMATPLTAREGAEVSEADAEALLLYDLIAVAHAVNELVFAPLTQNQFDALVSFAFNIGLDALPPLRGAAPAQRGRAAPGRLRHGAVAQGRLRGRADRRSTPWCAAARPRRPCS